MNNPLNEGDVFLVPLTDESFVVGQLIKITKEALNSVVCAFYSVKLKSENEYSSNMVDDKQIISVQFVTPDLLKNKEWKVVDNIGVVNIDSYIDLNEVISKKYIGVKVVGSGNIKKFLSAYFGLYPWDFWFKPDYCDMLLFEGVERPSDLIFEKQKERS